MNKPKLPGAEAWRQIIDGQRRSGLTVSAAAARPRYFGGYRIDGSNEIQPSLCKSSLMNHLRYHQCVFDTAFVPSYIYVERFRVGAQPKEQ